MKPADDPNNPKILVQQGYDRCAATYNEARKNEAGPELHFLTRNLEDGAAVLDVGCGVGVPYTQALAQRFTVTGVDSSSEMIQRARANVPNGSFIHADIMSVEFPPSGFNGVVAFYSIFHLPREEHSELFRRIYNWLQPGGYFLCTLAHSSEEAYTEDDFFGVTMYWSNCGHRGRFLNVFRFGVQRATDVLEQLRPRGLQRDFNLGRVHALGDLRNRPWLHGSSSRAS